MYFIVCRLWYFLKLDATGSLYLSQSTANYKQLEGTRNGTTNTSHKLCKPTYVPRYNGSVTEVSERDAFSL